jgi:predicted enzyme related to lactoylglutathione lyase
VPPFDVHDQGRMAAFLDPGGAPFSVWQAGTMRGAGLFDVPGALTWNELNTRDVEMAHAFYGAVFGWQFRHSSLGEVPYLVAKLNETAICGIQPMTAEEWPADMASNWMVYFAVQDTDRSAEHAMALGGRMLFPPMSLQIGRYAVLSDPQGGMFAVLASNR